MDGLVIAHAAATWFMAGVIAFVQVVHYPLMASVGEGRFAAYEAAHARRTTWVVLPPMTFEAATAALFVWRTPPSVTLAGAWAGLALVAVVWLSTAFVQVPLHRRLHGGFDRRAHRLLVGSNLVRAAAWGVRAVLVTTWLA